MIYISKENMEDIRSSRSNYPFDGKPLAYFLTDIRGLIDEIDEDDPLSYRVEQGNSEAIEEMWYSLLEDTTKVSLETIEMGDKFYIRLLEFSFDDGKGGRSLITIEALPSGAYKISSNKKGYLKSDPLIVKGWDLAEALEY